MLVASKRNTIKFTHQYREELFYVHIQVLVHTTLTAYKIIYVCTVLINYRIGQEISLLYMHLILHASCSTLTLGFLRLYLLLGNFLTPRGQITTKSTGYHVVPNITHIKYPCDIINYHYIIITSTY